MAAYLSMYALLYVSHFKKNVILSIFLLKLHFGYFFQEQKLLFLSCGMKAAVVSSFREVWGFLCQRSSYGLWCANIYCKKRGV